MLIQIASRYAKAEHYYMKHCLSKNSFHSGDRGEWGYGGLPLGQSFRITLSDASENAPLQDRSFAKTLLDCH